MKNSFLKMSRRTKIMIPATTKMCVRSQYANTQTHKITITMALREPEIPNPGHMTHITDTMRTRMDIANHMRLTLTRLNSTKANTRDQPRYTDTRAITGIHHLDTTMMTRINPLKMEMNQVISMDTTTTMVGTGLIIPPTPQVAQSHHGRSCLQCPTECV